MEHFTQDSSENAFNEQTVCELIANQSNIDPKRIAIVDGKTEIDYERLVARSNAIAFELVSRGVQPGALVGVCMSRTWELVATLLGVLRAGCAYVPLDPTYPQDRVHYMLEHSRASAAIVDCQNTATLCQGVKDIIWLDSVKQVANIGELKEPSSTDLAYVIYTSGSTGQPKGVAIEHHCIVALSRTIRELLSDEELSGVSASTSVCFDPSVLELFAYLSLGATLVLAQNALELPHLPAAERLRTCNMVPSAMQALLSAGDIPKGIRCLIFGGEVLKHSLVDQLYALNPDLRLINVYGPTEDTVFSTVHEVCKEAESITIGKPVTNSHAYILDDAMHPVPVGVAGELYLAGDKLARGYLYDDELTKRRFIETDAHEGFPTERLYRTGDLCQWRENGEIEFLGRVDQQVKIRGFRIELEEIESALESMPGVDAAAAAALDGGVGQKLLVMYVVSQSNAVTASTVKEYLAERLPKYMVPQVVMHLDELPLLPNGKLDRKQLPDLEEVHNTEQRELAGGSAISEVPDLLHRLTCTKEEQPMVIQLVIQRELAGLLNFSSLEQISPERTFDELGLDSLTTVELSSRLTKILSRPLPAQAILDHPTPASLVQYILHLMNSEKEHGTVSQPPSVASETLTSFQSYMQSSHPTFQAAKAAAWSATDKGKLVQEVMHMVNSQRRNPYSKVLRTGSGTRGTVADAYTDEEREAIIWTTNLYLGMNRDEDVIEQASDALHKFGTGMGTSAAASGLTDLHLQFETDFAELVGKSGACLFPTGYTANIGAVAGLLGENDVVVVDQLCHASIVDGARLCGATIRTFKHNSAADLETVLESEASPYRTVLVVIEGVYSMGEGAAPVAEIVRMAKKYNALVLVDEAHSFGFYGERGAGICAAQGVTDQVDFIMTTLSKSLGSLGGVVAASKEHVDLLKSSARAYIFQASVSPADIAAALTSLRRIRTDDSLRERLWDTARYMREQFSNAGFDLGTGDGPIVTPHFGDKDKLYAIVQSLFKRGVQTSAVTYPIVEVGRGRLRFICSAAHTREDVDKTLAAMIESEREADELLASVAPIKPAQLQLSMSDVEDWANVFADYLKTSVIGVAGPTPNLAVSIVLADGNAPITVMIDQGVVTVGMNKIPETPAFSMVLTNNEAAAALCASDVQGLLSSVCDGACELNGQVEPFIWLIARMAEQRDSMTSVDEMHDTAEAVC